MPVVFIYAHQRIGFGEVRDLSLTVDNKKVGAYRCGDDDEDEVVLLVDFRAVVKDVVDFGHDDQKQD